MNIVVIGAGPAGVSVVETVRHLDQQVKLTVLSAESSPPYSPPAMIDHFLTGSEAHLWRGTDWPARMDIDYRSGVEVTGIDPGVRRLQLSGGSALDYDRLVIATGGSLYAPLEGAELKGVYNFKSLSAAEALIQQVKTGQAQSALVVGAGFIGMEIALLLRTLDVKVTQIEMLNQVMAGMLNADSATIAQRIMQDRGIDLRLDTKAVAFIGNGRAEGVRLETGEVLRADVLVAATGIKPNLSLLIGSGIQHGWGISVDERMQTSAEDVYAAGDVVETADRLTGEIYVHAIFPNAVEQGRVAALNILGYETLYEGADRMNSLKHLDLPIMAVGLKEGDQILSNRQNGNLKTLYLRDERLVGFQLVGDIRAAGVLRSLINQGRNLRQLKDRLLDPNFGMGMTTWEAISAVV